PIYPPKAPTMSTNRPSTFPSASLSTSGQHQQPPQIEKTYFEEQRELLVLEIAQSLETVLQNINKLNRSLEEVIAVGNEFAPVEALWSQFEGVMGNVNLEEEEGEEEAVRDQGHEGGEEGEDEAREVGERGT
ncbi:hypothetical protein M011DRAFT_401879, partial [Sporormia fimetaria CBS 119925]